MWFGVLGPLLVQDEDSVTSVPAGRQRVLLATLMMWAGTVVSADVLAEYMWDGAPPAGAATTLRSHAMRLRRALGPAAGAHVLTQYPGYLLDAGEDAVDLLRFRRLCQDGEAATRAADWARAWQVLAEGLRLWRGEPLADVPSESLRRDLMPGLEQLRLQAAEWWADAGLRLGHHAELVPDLESLTATYPLRERFHGQLMLALAHCGREAEALAAYCRARDVLVEELGAEPGSELRDLYQRILTAGTASAAPESATLAGVRPAAVVPRELPRLVPGFTGRAGELAALTKLLDRTIENESAAIVISAIGGMAGVGKTALAVHCAHQAADRFPDGQLYVNLRGYDLDQPMAAAEALARFLRALGVGGQEIPAEEAERAARYRSLLAGKKVLIVLDNARSVEQVRPLLPGCPACAVVVTSRDSLAGLVARDGATRLDLDLLSSAEAVRLLRELIGARACDNPAAAQALAEQCCRLPLALRVAAELAVARPDVPLAELADGLADEQKRLDLLDAGGDPRTAVRAVFSWSIQHLDADAARTFRLLGLHPGPDFDPYAAAALSGTSLEQARAALGTLTRAHLIEPAEPDRYGMHDLLRAYARELAASDGPVEQHTALTRLFDHYLYTTSIAMDTLYPAQSYRRPRIPPPATPIAPVTHSPAARAWLDAERAALVAVTVHSAGHGWPSHATRLAATLFRSLDAGGYYPEAITIYSQARAAAQRLGDPSAEATAVNYLGGIHWRQSRYQEAEDYLRQALTLSREARDRTGQARTLNNLGLITRAQGHYQDAIGLHLQALDLYQEIGDLAGKAYALGELGVSYTRQGRYNLAARHHRQALAIAVEISDRVAECAALINLGCVGLRQGRYLKAAGHLDRALAMSRELGHRDAEAETLTRIGDVCLRQGHAEEASGHLRQALALYREIGNRSGEADALNSLGEVMLATGQPGNARSEYGDALGLVTRTDDKYQQARARHGLGQTYQVDGDLSQARRHWLEALALFSELGTPEAGQVRAQLRAMEDNHRARQARQ